MQKIPFYLLITFLLLSCSQKSTDDEFAPLFPFLISYDGPENVTNMSHLLDAPAGKYGFVRVEDGRFVTDNGPIRFHGTNLTGPANFPSHEDADLLAERLARFGINCVRLHYFDAYYGNFRNEPQPGIIADDPETQRNLDPDQLDKLDYMISVFKEKGIYVNINLHVARKLDERDGFTGVNQRPHLDKGVDNFEPRMIELQKEYAKKLLTHVNPYTQLAYSDDPCVAMIELNNENALFSQYHRGGIESLPEPYSGELRAQWNRWLKNKYSSTNELLNAWKWKAIPLHDEQISEGKFDAPVSIDGKVWILSEGSSSTTCNVEDDVLKIKVSKEGSNYFPKLFRNVKIKKGEPYTLSFKVRKAEGEGSTALGLAIADAKNGWRSLGLHQIINVGKDWKEYSYSFVATDDSDNAQFQLTRFSTGTFDLDDLSFQSGAKELFDKDQSLEKGNISSIMTGDFAPLEAQRDFYQFLVDTEHNYWVGLSDYLKDELNVKSVISGTQLGYSPPFVQAELDYIDSHAYWCHPSPVNENWRIRNESMVNSMSNMIHLSTQRIIGKPYTVSEYNHPFPNQYGSEGQPMLRSFGALQGWDGVFEYTFHHRKDFQLNHNIYFFSVSDRTDVLAHFPACAAIYLRADVKEAKNTIEAPLDYETYFDRLVSNRAVGANISVAGFDTKLSLIHKTGVKLNSSEKPESTVTSDPAGKVVTSDTDELTWNHEIEGAGYFTVNTDNTKLFTGFPEGRKITLGDVELSIGNTRLGWATVSLVSQNANGFGKDNKSSKVLVTATGLVENKGMQIKEVDDKHITLTDWGEAPVYVEGVPVTITLLSNPDKVKCFALDPEGERKSEVPVKSAKGKSEIKLTPDFETVWYEIEIN